MFSREYRLRHERDVKQVLDKGRTCSCAYFLYKFRKNDLGHPRFTVIAGKKISSQAVVRNRKKRQIREAVWKLVRIGRVTDSVDGVFLLRKEILNATAKQIREEICGIFGVKSCE